MNLDLLAKLMDAEQNFKGTSFESIVKEAWNQFNTDKMEVAKDSLNKLPTPHLLLKNLIEKLQGKSVYKTLRRINEGKVTDTDEMLKGIFSLSTHVIIECQQGKPEYRLLLPILYKRIGELIYSNK